MTTSLLARGLVAAGCLVLLGACTAKTDESAKQPPAAVAPNVVTVHAMDFAYHAPDTVPAGLTTFKLENTGTTFHHLVIVRLDSGKTIADLSKAFATQGPPPHWMAFVGGPNAPNPHASSNATVNLTPGNYAMVCMVDMPDHVPHFAKGMLHAFTVTPSTGPAATAPTADVDVTLSDYKFTLSKELKAGTHTFSVHTDAQQPHELELIQLAPGKTADDLMKWMEKPQGPPPASGIGGVTPMLPGSTAYFTADLTAGEYVMICFLPDLKDPKKAHFMEGMMQTVKVM